IFGGTNFTETFNDAWVLSNANGLGGAPAWIQLSPSGTPVPAAAGHTAVYDPGTNQMIVFGFFENTPTFDTTWVLSNANGTGGTPAWTKLAPAGLLPPPRSKHTAVYDSARKGMFIFSGGGRVGVFNHPGGQDGAGPPTGTQLVPRGSPPAAR